MPLRAMIRLQGKVARSEDASPAATGSVIAGNWPLPVNLVLRTKMSCGRTNGARPSWVGSVLNWVQVLTFPWVLIRISIVNRVAAGPSGARPEGAAGQVWDALAAVAGVASRPAIRSSANTTAAATREIARRARPDALPRWFVTTPAIFGRGRQANGASPTNTRSLLQLCRGFRRGGSSRTSRTPRSPRGGHPRRCPPRAHG